jgi:ADP-heptose:LPS heptosyltransferase
MIFIIETGIGNVINKIDALLLAQQHDANTKVFCTKLLMPIFESAGVKNTFLINTLNKSLIASDEAVVFFYDCLRLKNIISVIGKRLIIQLDDRISLPRKLFFLLGFFFRPFGVELFKIDYYQHERVLVFNFVLRQILKQEINGNKLLEICFKTDYHNEMVKSLFDRAHIYSPIPITKQSIALQCGVANGKQTIKGLSPKKLAQLSDLLVHNGFEVILTGGESDVDYASQVLELCSEKVSNFVGSMSLMDTWAVLLRVHCVISFDSSIGHMAAYTRRPLVWVGGCGAFTRTRPWSKANLIRYVLCPTYQNYLGQNPMKEQIAVTKLNGCMPLEALDLNEILDAVLSFKSST